MARVVSAFFPLPSMVNNLLLRLESERDAARRRSEKLIKLESNFTDAKTIKELANMALAEERLAKFLQELINGEKAKAKER